jgi:hypothetical protein
MSPAIDPILEQSDTTISILPLPCSRRKKSTKAFEANRTNGNLCKSYAPPKLDSLENRKERAYIPYLRRRLSIEKFEYGTGY